MLARYYMETTQPNQEQNACKNWLMARTVGLPSAWNRLLAFNSVRSTRAVVYTPPIFVQDPDSGNCSERTADHLYQQPGYPDPKYYLSFLGKYFFRNARLRHLRPEQFNRYLTLADATSSAGRVTAENTIDVDNEAEPYQVSDKHHRNYDPYMETVVRAGEVFKGTRPGVPSARRRQDSRLGVSRLPLLEMSGSGREGFYQRPRPPNSQLSSARRMFIHMLAQCGQRPGHIGNVCCCRWLGGAQSQSKKSW